MTTEDTAKPLDEIRRIARRAHDRQRGKRPRCGGKTRRGGICQASCLRGRHRCKQHSSAPFADLPPDVAEERRARISAGSQAVWDARTPEERERWLETSRRGWRLWGFRRSLLCAVSRAVREPLPPAERPPLAPLCHSAADAESARGWGTCRDERPRGTAVFWHGPLYGFDRWGEPIAAEQEALDVIERGVALGFSTEHISRLLNTAGHCRHGGRRWSGRHVRKVIARWRAEGRRRRSYAYPPLSGEGSQLCRGDERYCRAPLWPRPRPLPL